MVGKTLLVFAHADEAAAFAAEGIPHVVTGVGKINATFELTRVLVSALEAGEPIARVVVLGTAGGVSDGAHLDTVYQIEAAVQHDFSLPSPRIELTGERVVSDVAVIATGDVFVQDDAQRVAISAAGATLVDMESYAYARVCAQLELPVQIFKVPSDFADSSTTQDEWDGIVVSKSRQLLDFARERLPELLDRA